MTAQGTPDRAQRPVDRTHKAPKHLPEEASGARVRQHMWRLAAIYGAVGIEVAASVAGGALAGHCADGRITPGPWGFFFGTAIGCGAAVKALVRLARMGRQR